MRLGPSEFKIALYRNNVLEILWYMDTHHCTRKNVSAYSSSLEQS